MAEAPAPAPSAPTGAVDASKEAEGRVRPKGDATNPNSDSEIDIDGPGAEAVGDSAFASTQLYSDTFAPDSAIQDGLDEAEKDALVQKLKGIFAGRADAGALVAAAMA